MVEPHLAAQMSQDFSVILEFDPELGVREGLGDDSVCLGQLVIGHILTVQGLFYQARGVKSKQELLGLRGVTLQEVGMKKPPAALSLGRFSLLLY